MRKNGKVKAIPKTDEEYISFSKNLLLRSFKDKEGKEKKVFHDIRFIDTLQAADPILVHALGVQNRYGNEDATGSNGL